MCVKQRGWAGSVEGKEGPIKNELNHKTVTHFNRWSTIVTYLTIRRESFDNSPEVAKSDPIGKKTNTNKQGKVKK